MKPTSFLGLGNEEADMNCFLNSSLQALFHLPNLEINSTTLPYCTQPSHSCLAKILIEFYSRYTEELGFSGNEILFPIDIRHKLAEIYNSKNFAVQEKADSMEVLNVLLTSLHNSYNGICDSIDTFQVDNCQCIVHRQMILDIDEIYKCECGLSTVIKNSGFQTFIAEKFSGDFLELNKHKQEFPYTQKHFLRFTEYLKQQISEGLTRTCECERKVIGKKILKRLPECLIFQIVSGGQLYNKLSTLELIVSLNLSIDIAEIYEYEESQNYNIAGFIINLPGHYIYVGRINDKWWIVNDSKVDKVEDHFIIKIIANLRCRIVGVIYHKEKFKYKIEINSMSISLCEKLILKEQECKNCVSICLTNKCDDCGYDESILTKKWICEDCNHFNIKTKQTCLKCNNKRFKEKKKLLVGKFNYLPCKKCNLKLNILMRFCESCGTMLTYINNNSIYLCEICSCEVEISKSICYLCASNFWTCQQCGNRESSNKCEKCSWIKGTEFWYCHECKILNPPNSPCKTCKNPKKNHYCPDCGNQSENESCSCYYKSSCSKCHISIKVNQSVYCSFCGEVLYNNYCHTCYKYIPRNMRWCSECKDSLNRTENPNIRIAENSLCSVCKKLTFEEYAYCWRCRGKIKKNECICNKVQDPICYFCLKITYRCFKCRGLIIDNKCDVCDKIELPRFVNSRKINKPLDNCWECISCNFYNNISSLFCERCNFSRDYDFIRIYTCEFCNKKSHSPHCLKCSIITNCSSCEKAILFSQSLNCPNCGMDLDDNFCQNCNLYIGIYRILCRLCALKMPKCSCGFPMHPKSLKCRHCIQKVKFTKILCFLCNEVVLFNFCCFCGNQIFQEGKCSKCYLTNSFENLYYCRLCSLEGYRCKICKQRSWGNKCCKQKRNNN
ncbi:hypothetical protein SteCoe_9589 [Stentor coeruleus]|uniref:USP domain-containing protein n=1 Tax=Stentor coeruleus TaxID=5963 RepID=A0A1R2CHH9_9CILI|nr:hypothetical protein SteCoe_9589 [Stentor coeruleus]